jgi:hypothetical protein
MKFTKLPSNRFWSEYKKSFAKVAVPTERDKEALRNRISCLQQALVKELSKSFAEDEDFAIGWDFNYCYHVCGGVFSDSTISRKLLRGIVKALSTDSDPSCWTFHATVEAQEIDGQFYVRNGEVVFPGDGPDFSKLMA